MRINELTRAIISSSMKVHSFLGPGVLESAYHVCLVHELRKRDLVVRERVQMPIVFDGVRIDFAYEADLIINEAVIVELKAVARLHPVHEPSCCPISCSAV